MGDPHTEKGRISPHGAWVVMNGEPTGHVTEKASTSSNGYINALNWFSVIQMLGVQKDAQVLTGQGEWSDRLIL